jgi:hypothetical protein
MRGSAAEAFLHLFKLPPRDAHERILPAAKGMQKQKRRGETLRRGVWRTNPQMFNVSDRDPNQCRDRCRNYLGPGFVRTTWVTVTGAAMMTAGCVAIVVGLARRLVRCGGWLRVRWIGPGGEPV